MTVWKNFDKLTLMSISIFMLLTAYGTCQIFISKLLKDNNLGSLGFLALSCLYIFYTVTSLFATSIINWFGSYNRAFSFAAMGYTLFIACFLLPAFMAKKIAQDPSHMIPESGLFSRWPITVFYVMAAAACGTGQSILGVARGSYISKAACESNKGFYNSYVFSWGLAASLIGNPIAAIIIQKGGLNGQIILFVVFTGLAIISIFLFLFVEEPEEVTEDDTIDSHELIRN